MKTERCCDDHFQILLHIPSFEGGALPWRRVDDAALLFYGLKWYNWQ